MSENKRNSFFPLSDDEYHDYAEGIRWVKAQIDAPSVLSADPAYTARVLFGCLTGDLPLFRQAMHLLFNSLLNRVLRHEEHRVWLGLLIDKHLQPYADQHPELGAFYPLLTQALRGFCAFAGKHNPKLKQVLTPADRIAVVEAMITLVDALKYHTPETNYIDAIDRMRAFARDCGDEQVINHLEQVYTEYLAKQGNIDDACHMGKPILSKWTHWQAAAYEANWRITLTNLLIAAGELEQAQKTWESVLKTALLPGVLDVKGMYRYVYTSGVLLFMDRHYGDALTIFETLLQEYEALGSPPYEIAMTQYMIAYCLCALETRDHEVLPLLESATATYQRLYALYPLAQCSLTLAWWHDKYERHAASEEAFYTAYESMLLMDPSNARSTIGDRIVEQAKMYAGLHLEPPPPYEG